MSTDWRLQGQEAFLKDIVLYRRKYTPLRSDWEHDHCEFCGKKFSAEIGDETEGYSTADGYHWICRVCFADFLQKFNWQVVDIDTQEMLTQQNE